MTEPIFSINDQVICCNDRYGQVYGYTISTVVKITATQIVIANGDRLGYNGTVIGSGNYNTHTYQLATPSLLKTARDFTRRQTRLNWFDAQTWTDDQKIEIYKLMKK